MSSGAVRDEAILEVLTPSIFVSEGSLTPIEFDKNKGNLVQTLEIPKQVTNEE